jgi:hypothetical protein
MTTVGTIDVEPGTHIFLLFAYMGEEDDTGFAGRRSLALFFIPG